MSPQRPKAYYTAVFLQVSFQAIKNSMAGKASDTMPCWLDSKMLMMLSRELKECQAQAEDNDAARNALSQASDECDALLKRCPGGLDAPLCHRHLDAILGALKRAGAALPQTPAAPPSTRWEQARQRFREGVRWLR
ncbi:hypothetical protein RAN53_10785 [Halomonas sp. SSL-5]|uniref:hypothetical protein n=1 Tax=Halomonas sp. SSL-5 TaxID=3065855 RepID=UPI002739BD4B|nr:hypothetical protein [Halomonas sp. SSL-5]MDY7116835.1 hypothetical protein [Halomonas sp. SSL-5]